MQQAIPKRITDKKHVSMLVLLCSVVYFTSYLTRVNYKAVLSEFEKATNTPDELASIALTGLFITYGLGQLVSGWLGDRIKPRYLMTLGMLVSSLMNILLPLNVNPVYMTVVWCINGFGQAMMWPPIVKTLTNHLTSEAYIDASVKVSWGSAVGTIAVYLISPFIISVFNDWRMVFYASAVLGLVGAALTFFGLKRIEVYADKHGVIPPAETAAVPQKDGKNGLSLPKSFYPLLGVILLAIVLQGVLRDGIDTRMPFFFQDNYGTPVDKSILTAVILPIFAFISYSVTEWIYKHFFKNEMICSAVVFGVGIVFLLPLTLLANPALGTFGTVASVICFAFGVASMHAVNLVLITFVPRRFKKYGNIGTMSGVLNFATYVGSALSGYGFAALIKHLGWTWTILIWVFIAAAGLICCLLSAKAWKKFTE